MRASLGSVVSDLNNRRDIGEALYGGPVAGVYTRMGNTALDQTTAMMDLLGRQLAAGGVTKANPQASGSGASKTSWAKTSPTTLWGSKKTRRQLRRS
jgi:hypothetical protein